MSSCRANFKSYILQSGFEGGHSSEKDSKHFGKCDRLRRADDRRQTSILILLDLSTAFNTITHSILIKRLNTFFYLFDTALD